MAGALSARETAYSALRSRILNLDLKPNDSLNGRELAQQLKPYGFNIPGAWVIMDKEAQRK